MKIAGPVVGITRSSRVERVAFWILMRRMWWWFLVDCAWECIRGSKGASIQYYELHLPSFENRARVIVSTPNIASRGRLKKADPRQEMEGQATNTDSGSSFSVQCLLTNVEPLNAFNQEQVRRRNAAETTVFSSTTASRLSHPPLKDSRDFRLLQIGSELADGLLDCSLKVVCLDDAPDYAALSYVWDASSEARKITCNECKVEVTDNLYAALCRLQRDQSGQPLWVDAICINQQDVVEENHQVHMMKDIYTKAQHVSVWLDEETHATAQVWAFFDFLQVGFNERHARLERNLNDTTQWKRSGFESAW